MYDTPCAASGAALAIQRQNAAALSGGVPLYDAVTTTNAPPVGRSSTWSSSAPTVTSKPRSVPSSASRAARDSAVPRLEPNSTVSRVPCRGTSRAGAGAGAAPADVARARAGSAVSARLTCTPGRRRTRIRKSAGLTVSVVFVTSW